MFDSRMCGKRSKIIAVFFFFSFVNQEKKEIELMG